MMAGREGHAAVLQLLADAGADLNMEDKVSMPDLNNDTLRPTATYDGEHRRVTLHSWKRQNAVTSRWCNC
jgi:hypothetical protein